MGLPNSLGDVKVEEEALQEADKPLASMSWSARRLQQEPFDERPAWKLPPAGSSPHWLPDSALF